MVCKYPALSFWRYSRFDTSINCANHKKNIHAIHDYHSKVSFFGRIILRTSSLNMPRASHFHQVRSIDLGVENDTVRVIVVWGLSLSTVAMLTCQIEKECSFLVGPKCPPKVDPSQWMGCGWHKSNEHETVANIRHERPHHSSHTHPATSLSDGHSYSEQKITSIPLYFDKISKPPHHFLKF